MADKWKKLPKGWTDKSRKDFWESLTSGAPKHKVTECIKKMQDTDITNPGAFCAALADRVTPGWRSQREASDPWITQKMMWKRNPRCAKRMKRAGFSKIRESVLRKMCFEGIV